MKIIGLTGGIACGKSLATKTFEEEGIPVLDCDKIARQVVEPGKPALDKIVVAFKKDVEEIGESIELPDGSLNRKALGKVVFKNDAKRQVLTNITGRAIFTELLKSFLYHWLIGTPLIVVDAPTLYESKFLIGFCSEIVVIAVKPELQLLRLVLRDNSSHEDAMARINSQMPIEDKVKRADITVWNDSTPEDFVKNIRIEAEKLKKSSKGLRMLFSGPGFVLIGVILYFVAKHK